MAGHSDHQVAFIPAQPAMLIVGDRRIPFDEWPLAKSIEEHRSVEVHRPSEDLLVIQPKQRTFFGIVARYLLVVGVGVVPAVVGHVVEWPSWLSILFGVAGIALLVLAIRAEFTRMRRLRFDRLGGRFTMERRVGLGRKWLEECSHGLGTILAVQLLHNGRHTITESQGGGEQQATTCREFHGYELNIILDEHQPSRINLLCTTDWNWIRRTGQSIGAFLDIPVIDKLHHG